MSKGLVKIYNSYQVPYLMRSRVGEAKMKFQIYNWWDEGEGIIWQQSQSITFKIAKSKKVENYWKRTVAKESRHILEVVE